MDVFNNTNKMKKLMIVLVLLILFNFCCPKVVRAGDVLNSVYISITTLFFWVADLPQLLLEELFLDNNNETEIEVTAENIIKGKFLLMSPNIFEDPSANSSKYLDYDGVHDRKRDIKRYNCWVVLCIKKLSYSSIIINTCICWYKNDIVNCITR